MFHIRIKVFDGQHVPDLFHRCVHDEDTADDKDAGGKVDAAGNDAFPFKDIEGFGHRIDQSDHDEQQNNPQGDSNNDPPTTHGGLKRNGRTLAFDADIQQVIKA